MLLQKFLVGWRTHLRPGRRMTLLYIVIPGRGFYFYARRYLSIEIEG